MADVFTGKVACLRYNHIAGYFSVRDGSGVSRAFILWFLDYRADGPIALYIMTLMVALARGLEVDVVYNTGSSAPEQLTIKG